MIAAGLTSLGLVGDYTYFGSTPAVLPLGEAGSSCRSAPLSAAWPAACSAAFSSCSPAACRARLGALINRHPIGFAMVCGLGVALCGLASRDTIYGTGYEEARAIVHGAAPTSAIFGPLKFLATTLSSISGIPGGILRRRSPSAPAGGQAAPVLSRMCRSAPWRCIGMVSYLAGAVQTPITSFVIVSEMTENHAMIIPLMLAALIADAVSKSICRGSLYHSLAEIAIEKTARRSPDQAGPGKTDEQ